VQQEVTAANASISNTWEGLGSDAGSGSSPGTGADGAGHTGQDWAHQPLHTPIPTYSHPKKKWRLKRSAMPNWYKQRQGLRTRAQSGAARVARFRPKAGAR
jgi:sec-independent protein translocase protein TatB